MRDEFGKDLNESQRNAVFFNDGPLLLIAGAGSGKTKTLVHRVARLIHEGISPESILLLTFTRKAANEMLARASRLLDSRCHQVSGGTFHSFSNTTLRHYSESIGYPPNFTIMDRSDSEDLIQLLRKEKGLGRTDKRFPKKRTLASIIGKSTNTTQPIDEIISKEYPQFIDFISEINHLSNAYHHQKKVMKVMDYDDLLTKLVDLLITTPQVRAQLQLQYRYIMVDEYQDTNTIQSTIIENLVNSSQNIMVVGDDSQSIYSFRGANYRNIMDFPQKYPQAQIITLTHNYRSTQPILDLTNEMISYAREKFTKTLVTDKISTQKPVYIETSTENMQSRFICKKILELREKGVELNDIAVLMRSGWHSNDLELELNGCNIPFVKYGGFKFVESAHIKDIIAILKLIYNPSDQLSWQRILVLFDGLGSAGATQLINDICRHLDSPSRFPMASYQTKKYSDEFKQLFALVFNSFQTPCTPAILLDAVLLFYTPLFKMTYDDHAKRHSDIESLEAITARFDDLGSLLTEMSLEPPTGSQADHSHGNSPGHGHGQGDDNEQITLSTIHSAKGLEWHTVFMMSCVDGYIPSFQSLGEWAQLEEERRLLYVALTRAKETLFILKPHLDLSHSNYYRYSGMSFSKLSRFLSDPTTIKPLMDRWVLDEETLQPRLIDHSHGCDDHSHGYDHSHDDQDSAQNNDQVQAQAQAQAQGQPKETKRRKYYF
jgi:DNA helicase-2/ATP-dependent DNA helicase PcrA